MDDEQKRQDPLKDGQRRDQWFDKDQPAQNPGQRQISWGQSARLPDRTTGTSERAEPTAETIGTAGSRNEPARTLLTT